MGWQVAAVEWSLSGMRNLVGDRDGNVDGKGETQMGWKIREDLGIAKNRRGVLVVGGGPVEKMIGNDRDGRVYGKVRGGGGVVEQFSGGGGSGGQWRRRRRRRVDCSMGNTRPKQGEAAVSAAGTAAARGGAAAVAAAEAAVGLLP